MIRRKFGRKKDHRDHLLRNLATSLVLYERIKTTAPKAKEVKSFVEQLIARSKAGDLNTIRELNTIFFDRNATKKVIEELLPRFKERNSGFVRSFHLENRLGDNSPMMILELMDKKVFVEEKKTFAKTKPAPADKKTESEKQSEVLTKTRVKDGK